MLLLNNSCGVEYWIEYPVTGGLLLWGWLTRSVKSGSGGGGWVGWWMEHLARSVKTVIGLVLESTLVGCMLENLAGTSHRELSFGAAADKK